MSKRRSHAIANLARRLRTDRRGNVLMITGFAILMLTFVTGMGVDYSRAMKLQTKLNAAADAAALAAVTQPMMLQDNIAATAAANNMFKSQASNLPGLIIDLNKDVNANVTGNDNVTNTRTAIVTWSAKSTNAFAGILHMATLPISGSATATATAAPNIDFYLALDTSPSMALPTTSTGIASMDAALNCSFACHSNKIQNYVKAKTVGYLPSLILDNTTFNIKKTSTTAGTYNGNPTYIIDGNNSFVYNNKTKNIASGCSSGGKNATDICVYNSDGTFVDSYWYALNQGIDMRVTAERAAIGDLMGLAKSYAAANNRRYQAALYTFDYSTNLKSLASLTSDLDSITTAASKIDVVQVNDQGGSGCPPSPLSCSTGTYLFTSFKSILDKMTSDLPAKSGKGTSTPGDTPQAFLFIVTDGMSDEKSSTVSAPYSLGQDRTRSEIVQAHIDQCNQIKARGIKIAILYTEYTSDSIKDDEAKQRDFVTANLPDVAPALTECASSPDLMYTVKTDESISDALQSLFTKAVATARLSK